MLSCLSGGMVNMVMIHVKRIIVCIMSPSLHGKLDFGAMRRAKRVYKTIPLDQKQTGNRGSATLEAMLVLPLFIGSICLLPDWESPSDQNAGI